jgi:NRAMP (natural resistance-associated macrophage protein)-like metal ion transporter
MFLFRKFRCFLLSLIYLNDITKYTRMQKKEGRFIRFLKTFGPGLVTGASDDDPSGIATYSQAGSQFGFSTLWTALLTFPLMASVQEMCARIGLVTSKGLTGTLKDYYPKWLLWSMVVFSTPAIILNIGSDIAGMGAVTHLLLPSVPSVYFSVFFTGLLLILIIRLPYQRFASILKWLCISLFVYFIVPFLTKNNVWQIVKHTIVPTIKFDKDFVSIVVAILGTTISPYLFFWQATMEVEEKKNSGRKIMVNKRMINEMKLDVDLGMLFSNLVMYFIILTTATVLFQNGIKKIDTVEQAAKALQPLAGNFAYYLFAIGIIGTGLLTIPVLSGALSYIYSEAFGWKGSLNKKFHQAKSFYTVIIISLLLGLAINYLGVSPIDALIYTAILYGITAPVLIGIVLHIANNKTIMKTYVNKLRSNILGWITLVLMSVAALFLLWMYFTGK